MRNQQLTNTTQISPKTNIQSTTNHNKQQYNQYFTELLQKNQSLVQIFEQSTQRTYDYPQVNLQKLRSTSSFRQINTKDSNTNQSKILNPIDVLKLKDILHTNNKPKKQIKINPQISQRTSPKCNTLHLNNLLTVNNQLLYLNNTKKISPKIKSINQYQVQENNLQFTNQLIKEFKKENFNLDIETPRFYGMA
ncbi:unnamed protein product [Paramecium sonneborni]|uniref:Uncharacterized protein n=1 Tax=Paramecium sonneborni TaxID=65129 RepID=A0A8S1NX40_9CILI|nr:unnamed protein product [Paramecium sonneborni]